MNKLKRYYEEGNEEKIEKYQYLIMLDLDKEELKKMKKRDEVVMEYENKVEEINKKEEYIPYLTVEEDNRKFMNTLKREAREEGLEEGRQEGLRQGIQKGIQKGIQEGRQEGIIQSMKALFSNGASLDLISKSFDMSIEEIKKIVKIEE